MPHGSDLFCFLVVRRYFYIFGVIKNSANSQAQVNIFEKFSSKSHVELMAEI